MAQRLVTAASFWLSLGALSALALSACQEEGKDLSQAKSGWEGPAKADGSRTFVVDWSCEPKRFDSSAEYRIEEQEEYCEWRDTSERSGEKTCHFTTSFDPSRSFFLNSRHRTGINSVPAAQQLAKQCIAVAQRRLKAGDSVGHNCTGLTHTGPEGESDCVPDRNSDPEICDKVRYMVGQQAHNGLKFSLPDMPETDVQWTKRPLMQFGLLTALPSNCVFTRPDHTEVSCKVDPTTACFDLAGQLRPGLRVATTPSTPR